MALVMLAAWPPPPARALGVWGPEKKEVVAREYGNIWVGLGYLTGDVTYQIGGKARGTTFGGKTDSLKTLFPLSELKWPLDALMFSVGGELRFLQKGELRLAFSKDLTDQPGKLADSDWEDRTPSPGTGFCICLEIGCGSGPTAWTRIGRLLATFIATPGPSSTGLPVPNWVSAGASVFDFNAAMWLLRPAGHFLLAPVAGKPGKRQGWRPTGSTRKRR